MSCRARAPRPSPALSGPCITGADGRSFALGDADHGFFILSMSKPFAFAYQALGGGIARERIGVNARLGPSRFAARRLPASG